MTETEWLEASSTEQMLAYLGEKASPRKRRLFACACVRRIWPLLDDGLRRAVKTAERFADGRVAAKSLANARQLARAIREEREKLELQQATWLARAARAAAQAVEALLVEEGPLLERPRDVREAPDVISATRTARTSTRAAEAQSEPGHIVVEPVRRLHALDGGELVREVFGNPFRRTNIASRWLTWKQGTVVKMAGIIYRKRCFRNLPTLADALEEAGCSDDAILTHCRAPVEHARGCWVVDGLLYRV